MKIYIINLDKDKKRLQFSQEQALKIGFTFERIAGIYAGDMSSSEIKNSVNSFRYRLRLGKQPRLGEIGCALSHIKIYKKMIDEQIPYACILEDDIIILDSFKNQLDKLSKWLNYEKPIVVRLNMPIENNNSNEVAIRDHHGVSACSYCLNLAAAKALFNDNYPMHTVADDWPFWDKYGIIELYNSNPKVCWHNNAASCFNSTIAEINNGGNNKIGSQWKSSIRRKCLKGIGIIYEWLYYHMSR